MLVGYIFFTYKATDILLSDASQFCYGERRNGWKMAAA
jgi:hypothetical protein